MPLETLWDAFRTEGYKVASAAPATTGLAHFYRAVLAFGHDDFDRAAGAARAAAEHEPGSDLFRQAAIYLARVRERGKAGVYVDGEAFAAFIRGGGNIGLYAAASEALNAVYKQYETLSLLDIGVGDGLALLPAMTKNIHRLSLIEPSEAMLARTTAELSRWGVRYEAYPTTLQAFMQTGGAPTWDVIQATWSLQSIPPDERPAIFGWLRAHGERVLIAEFDVPLFDELYHPDRVRHVLARYEQGLAEYADDGGLVAQGFLMPVMFGYFDRSADRTNWEGPVEGWIEGLRAAGFRSIRTQALYPYWWADAVLLDAR